RRSPFEASTGKSGRAGCERSLRERLCAGRQRLGRRCCSLSRADDSPGGMGGGRGPACPHPRAEAEGGSETIVPERGSGMSC
ncbi:hypothetical protein KHT87_22475, partial [Alkalihalobacillus clausii]|uniref:hypothetical protein n=1 Tax=Shouchella clausii TaxID=79880 RepID=UPI001C0B5B09